uniref:Ribosomal_L23eN domain-containing protein n=1 Tax=Trichuris muris TaxID=70415 RepID=A0A5S6QJ48_TRIMR
MRKPMSSKVTSKPGKTTSKPAKTTSKPATKKVLKESKPPVKRAPWKIAKKNANKLPKNIEKKMETKAVEKALKVKKKIVKAARGTFKRKIRTSVRFRRPRTYRPKRNPKYLRKSAPRRNRLDYFAVIKQPLTTESSMKKIEDNNTLVFLVHLKANKPLIKAAVKKLYNIDADKINTLIRPDGQKKAYVHLATDVDALDIANKIGII